MGWCVCGWVGWRGGAKTKNRYLKDVAEKIILNKKPHWPPANIRDGHKFVDFFNSLINGLYP